MNLKKNAVMWSLVLALVLIVTAGLYLATRKGGEAGPAQGQGAYARADVAAASTTARCWAIIGDGVYDMTGFAQEDARILTLCGTDATDAVSKLGPSAQENFASIRIGSVQE